MASRSPSIPRQKFLIFGVSFPPPNAASIAASSFPSASMIRAARSRFAPIDGIASRMRFIDPGSDGSWFNRKYVACCMFGSHAVCGENAAITAATCDSDRPVACDRLRMYSPAVSYHCDPQRFWSSDAALYFSTSARYTSSSGIESDHWKSCPPNGIGDCTPVAYGCVNNPNCSTSSCFGATGSGRRGGAGKSDHESPSPRNGMSG